MTLKVYIWINEMCFFFAFKFSLFQDNVSFQPLEVRKKEEMLDMIWFVLPLTEHNWQKSHISYASHIQIFILKSRRGAHLKLWGNLSKCGDAFSSHKLSNTFPTFLIFSFWFNFHTWIRKIHHSESVHFGRSHIEDSIIEKSKNSLFNGKEWLFRSEWSVIDSEKKSQNYVVSLL